MFDINMRLVSMLGLVTVIVLTGLTMDYFQLVRRPVRLGMSVAVLGIAAGVILTLNAVLPENSFYGPVFSQVKTPRKVVALTFDDGPNPPYTGQILDILKEYHIHATFFVVGQNVAKHPETLQRIVAEGHQIGNHSYHHVDLLKADRQTIAREIDGTTQAIASVTGQAPHVVRPPHGFRDPVVLEVMKERGLKVVEWSVISRDWTNPGVDVIVDRTVSHVKNGSIILLHDGDGVAGAAPRDQTVQATRIIIEKLLAAGYTFVTADEICAETGDKSH